MEPESGSGQKRVENGLRSQQVQRVTLPFPTSHRLTGLEGKSREPEGRGLNPQRASFRPSATDLTFHLLDGAVL